MLDDFSHRRTLFTYLLFFAWYFAEINAVLKFCSFNLVIIEFCY